MTTREQASAWGAPERLIQHWCRRGLLNAQRTGREWRIESGNRPPYRSGGMIVKWLDDVTPSASEAA